NNTILNNNLTQTGANTFTTGTGLTTIGGNLTIAGTTLTLSNAATLSLAGSQTSALNIASGLLNFDTSNNRIGINTTTPLAALDVRGSSGTITAASVSANTSYAAFTVDNSSGDIFTASRAGATKFTILSNGN